MPPCAWPTWPLILCRVTCTPLTAASLLTHYSPVIWRRCFWACGETREPAPDVLVNSGRWVSLQVFIRAHCFISSLFNSPLTRWQAPIIKISSSIIWVELKLHSDGSCRKNVCSLEKPQLRHNWYPRITFHVLWPGSRLPLNYLGVSSSRCPLPVIVWPFIAHKWSFIVYRKVPIALSVVVSLWLSGSNVISPAQYLVRRLCRIVENKVVEVREVDGHL